MQRGVNLLKDNVQCSNFRIVSQIESMFNSVSDDTLKRLVQLRSRVVNGSLESKDYVYMSAMGIVL